MSPQVVLSGVYHIIFATTEFILCLLVYLLLFFSLYGQVGAQKTAKLELKMAELEPNMAELRPKMAELGPKVAKLGP